MVMLGQTLLYPPKPIYLPFIREMGQGRICCNDVMCPMHSWSLNCVSIVEHYYDTMEQMGFW
jgi:hypothetical protein